MVPIASPTPRHASPITLQPLERPLILQSPPIYLSSDMPRSSGLFSPPRLMSPINLSSGMHNPKLSKASASCSSTKRRRTHPTTSRTTRRRHCSRPDCAITYVSNPHTFDQLPWISQIESEPPEAVDIWDIADLSLLPDPPSSGVGPIRNRKTSASSSSRSGVAPLGGTMSIEALDAGPVSSHLRSRSSLLPLQLLPAARSESLDLDPRTPPPRATFDPFEVTFRDLMPAFPPPRDESGTPARMCWTSDSSPLLPSPM